MDFQSRKKKKKKKTAYEVKAKKQRLTVKEKFQTKNDPGI